MISLILALALGVLPLFAQAGPSCPTASWLTLKTTKFVIGATPERVYGVSGDFFNAKWQGGNQIGTATGPSRRTLSFDGVNINEELMSNKTSRSGGITGFVLNWKLVSPVTFQAAAAQVRIPYYEQKFEVDSRCQGNTHSTCYWHTWLCVSGDSSGDAAMEYFDAKHRNGAQNIFRELGVQGWLEDQINGEIPGCATISSTSTSSSSSPRAATPTRSSTLPSSTTGANQNVVSAAPKPTASPTTDNKPSSTSPQSAPPTEPPLTPGRGGAHRGSANALFALAVGALVGFALV